MKCLCNIFDYLYTKKQRTKNELLSKSKRFGKKTLNKKKQKNLSKWMKKSAKFMKIPTKNTKFDAPKIFRHPVKPNNRFVLQRSSRAPNGDPRSANRSDARTQFKDDKPQRSASSKDSISTAAVDAKTRRMIQEFPTENLETETSSSSDRSNDYDNLKPENKSISKEIFRQERRTSQKSGLNEEFKQPSRILSKQSFHQERKPSQRTNFKENFEEDSEEPKRTISKQSYGQPLKPFQRNSIKENFDEEDCEEPNRTMSKQGYNQPPKPFQRNSIKENFDEEEPEKSVSKQSFHQLPKPSQRSNIKDDFANEPQKKNDNELLNRKPQNQLDNRSISQASYNGENKLSRNTTNKQSLLQAKRDALRKSMTRQIIHTQNKKLKRKSNSKASIHTNVKKPDSKIPKKKLQSDDFESKSSSPKSRIAKKVKDPNKNSVSKFPKQINEDWAFGKLNPCLVNLRAVNPKLFQEINFDTIKKEQMVMQMMEKNKDRTKKRNILKKKSKSKSLKC